MKAVGDHLAEYAEKSADASDFDMYSRSAFNRYYYAAFLAVRNALKSLDPIWATPSHQSIPGVLKGEVLKRIKREIQVAQKSGSITPSKGKQMFCEAGTAASELSNLLTSARETRRLADYEPETPVVKIGSVSQLGQSTLGAARNWEGRVTAQSKTILKIYDQLGNWGSVCIIVSIRASLLHYTTGTPLHDRPPLLQHL